MMDLETAEKKMKEFFKTLNKERPGNLAAARSLKKAFYYYQNNPLEKPENHYLECWKLADDESYVFIFQKHEVIKGDTEANNFTKHYEAIVVRQDGTAYEVYGACADWFFLRNDFDKKPIGDKKLDRLGSPTTGERWISSGIGRYQIFDKGIVRFEGWHDNAALPYFYNAEILKGNDVDCMVAVIDIRGFTKWSKGIDGKVVQDLLLEMEEILQNFFSNQRYPILFLKYTGDGFIVIHEWKHSELGEVDGFVKVCTDCCKEMGTKLGKKELKVGFGIDVGTLKYVLSLGRWDYFGDAINNASKLQAKAENEVIISSACYEKLKEESSKILSSDRFKPHSFVIKTE